MLKAVERNRFVEDCYEYMKTQVLLNMGFEKDKTSPKQNAAQLTVLVWRVRRDAA